MMLWKQSKPLLNTIYHWPGSSMRKCATSLPKQPMTTATEQLANYRSYNSWYISSTTGSPLLLPPTSINSSRHRGITTPVILPSRHFTRHMIPRKAALHLTPNARTTFQKLIAATNSEGIMLRYEISSQHALRMAFKFDLIKDLKELSADDEGVSLEILADGSPKPPSESWNDNLPKLYIHHGAFMKVLGGTLDVDLNVETGEFKPKLFDREGHELDPNA